MGPIAKKHAPFELVVYYPKTEEGKRELSERVADIHAETVLQMIHKQDCPSAQKLQLVDAVVETAKRRNRDMEG